MSSSRTRKTRIDTDEFKCIYYDNDSKYKMKLYSKEYELNHLYASGGFSYIYLLDINDNPFIIKITSLPSPEIAILKKINGLSTSNPHFYKMLDNFKCKKLNQNIPSIPIPSYIPSYLLESDYEIIKLEYIPFTLSKIFKEDLNEEKQRSICQQLYISILSFHLIGYAHNDVKRDNFLVAKTETPFFNYTIFGQKYSIKTFGYNVKIIDYGLAEPINSRNLLDDYLLLSSSLQNITFDFPSLKTIGTINSQIYKMLENKDANNLNDEIIFNEINKILQIPNENVIIE